MQPDHIAAAAREIEIETQWDQDASEDYRQERRERIAAILSKYSAPASEPAGPQGAVVDMERLQAWCLDPHRQRPELAFTAGPERELADMIEAMQAAQQQSPRLVEWKPIESAPKDGTWIVLTDGEKVSPGFWHGTYFGRDPDWITYTHRSDAELVPFKPTHWMNLPQPSGATPWICL